MTKLGVMSISARMKNQANKVVIGQPPNGLFRIRALVQHYYGINTLLLLLGGATIHTKHCIISHIIFNGIVGSNVREEF